MNALPFHWLKRFLVLLLLVPRLGLAAQDTPHLLEPVPPEPSEQPRRLEALPEPEHRPSPRGVRILAETGGGLLGSLGGGLALGLLGYGLCETTGFLDGWLGCGIPAYLGVLAGGAVGFPVGTWVVGDLAGGDGSLLATVGGATAGVVVGALLISASNNSDSFVWAPLAFGVAGTLLGYELSQRAPPPVQPLLGFSPHGAMVGMGGHF